VLEDVNQFHLVKVENLPEGWVDSSVSEIVQIVSTNKKKLAQKNYLEKGAFPVVDQGQKFISGFSNDEELLIQDEPPFIVFGDHSRAFKFLNLKFVPGADGIKVLKPLEVNPKWCFYIFQAIKLPNKGYSRHFQYLKEAYVPLPPPEQQKQIVAKIEQLFSHIDAGIEALNIAKQRLKQYRQSVLKAAVTGELSKEWREENIPSIGCTEERSASFSQDALPSVSTSYEPASQLLEHILKNRHQKWEEQQLEQFKAKGKLPKNDKWKEKYKELSSILNGEINSLPDLPDTWLYTKLGNVIEEHKYGTSKKCTYDSTGIGVLRIPNIAKNVIDSEDLKYAVFSETEKETYQLSKGDILIIRSNGSIKIVGKCALIDDKDISYLYAGYLIRLRPNLELVTGAYLIHCLSSVYLRNQIEFKAKSTSGVNNINSGEIQSLVIAICPKEEQLEINRLVDERLLAIERLSKELDVQLLKAQKTKQSILASAFSGKLI